MTAIDRIPLRALGSGLAGAAALTTVHETARRVVPGAPRMDTLGRRALARGMRRLGVRPPRGARLQALALLGDVVSNALYYALVGAGASRRALGRGALLGAAAGLGAVLLPPWLGLGRRPRGVTFGTQAMTVGLYLLGGLAAAAAHRVLAREPGAR